MSKIIDTSEPAKQSRFHPKSLVAIGVVVVVLIGVGSVVLMTQQNKSKTSGGDTEVENPIAAAHDQASEIASKNKAEALSYYDSQIADASSSAAKVELLLGKASVAFNAGDYDASLKAAQAADAIASSTGTLNTIAESYEMKGDKSSALEYYKKALAALPKSEVSNRLEVSLRYKIEELSKP